MPTNQIVGDIYVDGTLTCGGLAAPSNSILDANVSASSPLGWTKVKQQIRSWYQQLHGVVAVTARPPLYIARAAGDIYLIRAGLVIANVGAATVTVDLRKNGTTVLTAVINLTSAGVAYIATTGTVLTAPYVANDVFELVIVATAGGGTLGQGLFVDVIFRELPG